MKLNDQMINNIKSTDKPFKLSDGKGMHLLVQPNGSKYWRFQYRFGGKQKLLAIGVYPQISLMEARQKTAEARNLLEDNIDPSEKKKSEKNVNIEIISFESVAIEWYNQTKNWSEDHKQKIINSLHTHIFPFIGKKDIKSLKIPDILNPLRIIEKQKKYELAKRLLQRIICITRYARQHGIVDYNYEKDLKDSLEQGKRMHLPAIKLVNIPDLLQNINNYDTNIVVKNAIKLNLLTFVRLSELRFARWSEIDFENKRWTIPAERENINHVKFSERGCKKKIEHIVPLSKQSLSLLMELKEVTDHQQFIFYSLNDINKPISENTINAALRDMGYDTKKDICGHGFRTIACSTLVESAIWNNQSIERQMSHYADHSFKRSHLYKVEYLKERIEIMQWWADYLDKCVNHYIPAYSLNKDMTLKTSSLWGGEP